MIFGRPWLSKDVVYINYKSKNVTLSYGQYWNKLTLYPLAKPFLEVEDPLWIEWEEYDALFGDVVKLVPTIKKTLALKDLDEDIMISNFMQNVYPLNVQIWEYVEQSNEKELNDEDPIQILVTFDESVGQVEI